MRNVKCYDNGGRSFDRYTTVYMNEPEANGTYGSRGMSKNPFAPQGFGQCCIARPGKHLGRRIKFEDLPQDCQRLVKQDLGLSL
jgi:hypothetical protein